MCVKSNDKYLRNTEPTNKTNKEGEGNVDCDFINDRIIQGKSKVFMHRQNGHFIIQSVVSHEICSIRAPLH